MLLDFDEKSDFTVLINVLVKHLVEGLLFS